MNNELIPTQRVEQERHWTNWEDGMIRLSKNENGDWVPYNVVIQLATELESAQQKIAELEKDKSVDEYIERVEKKLKEVSKGEYHTWGFVQMFIDIMKQERPAIAAQRKEK